MLTKRYDKSQLEEIKKALAEGQVIAFPTETVYGLGVVYYNEEALDHLKKAKMRDKEKPIPTMVRNIDQLEKLVVMNERIRIMAQKLMPGPLTIVCQKLPEVPDYVSNGLDTIAIRMPNDEFVLSLLDQPMLVTSANLSGEVPMRCGEDVLKTLDGRIDGIVMGTADSDLASTIIDMTSNEIKILRQGAISPEKIEETLREVKK